MLPCTVTRGFQSKDLPRSGSANEILAMTRENVPEERCISYNIGGGYETMFEPLLGLLTRDTLA